MPAPSAKIDWPSCLWAVLAAGLVILGYCRYFSGSYFTQDDYVWLCFGKFFAAPLSVFWRDTLCGQFYRPLTQLWFWCVHAIGGESVLPYQVAFLSIHLLNAGLAGLLARRIAGAEAGWLLALLFALNPLFLSPISGYFHYCGDTLGLTFYLATLWLVSGQPFHPTMFLLSLLTAALAYCSKEAYFTLPGALVLVLGLRLLRPTQTSADDRAGGTQLPEPAPLDWSWRELWKQRGRFSAHVGIWLSLLLWRAWIIERIGGGYGLARAADPVALLDHALERVTTFLALAAWSLVPHVTAVRAAELVTFLIAVVGLAVVSALVWRSRAGAGGVAWLWGWMVIAWAPSALMTTFAGVSWYAGSFATLLMVVLMLQQWAGGRWWVLALAGYYSLYGLGHFLSREPYIARLRTQHRALRTLYPRGGVELGSARVFLLNSCPDLFPDAIVKYGVRPGDPMPPAVLLNAQTPVDWVIGNAESPEQIAPLFISPEYQDGFMEMTPYRVYPLSSAGKETQILQRGPPFRFLRWSNGQLEDITDQNPALRQRSESADRRRDL